MLWFPGITTVPFVTGTFCRKRPFRYFAQKVPWEKVTGTFCLVDDSGRLF